MNSSRTTSMVAAAASAAATWIWLHSNEKRTLTNEEAHMLQLEASLRALEELAKAPSTDGKKDSQWIHSLENALGAIVTVRVLAVRHFDGDRPMYSVATGFIVDKKRGLILTNRHVVTPGPVVADAIFVNHEEVDLVPIYRDPVHDFGFFRFDPSAVDFLELHEIPLRPDLARVGTEIRVVGNDNAEKVQILPGILAKLDRAAPQYGLSGYNDFNTFYYAAASSTSGGSSGSPVLNIDGAAVALNAGGATNAASSYYLPLDRVKRALSFLQAGKLHIPRGTWQTIFRHVAFDEARKLGLSTDQERAIRSGFPQGSGVLVVEQVVPLGPADGILSVGDILIQLGQSFCTTFLDLENVLDDKVGETIDLTIQRGETLLEISLTIQDLHSITPNRFLEIGQCLLHDLSYQQARNMALPAGSVYLASPGHMLYKADIYDSCVIVSLNDTETPTLDAFIEMVKGLPHGTKASIQYFNPNNRHVVETAVITVDRQWFPMQLYTRNDADGVWHPLIYPVPKVLKGKKELNATSTSSVSPENLMPLQADDPKTTQLLSAMVFVRFDTPLTIDGIPMSSYDGIGYIFDSKQGYVLVDQYSVPVMLGEVQLTIAGSMQVPAAIRFVHPIHNFAILQFDVALVPSTLVSELPLDDKLTSLPVKVGDALNFVGLTRSLSVLTMKSVVTKIERLVTADFKVPRYKPSNVELLSFDLLSTSTRGGVFMDENGSIVALYMAFVSEDNPDGHSQAFAYGMPIHLVRDVVQTFKLGDKPTSISYLPVQFTTMSVSDARAGLGLAPERVLAIETTYHDTRQVLSILRCTAGTQASSVLRSGDILLAIDDQIVAKDDDVARLCAGKVSVDALVLRDKNEVTIPIEMCELSAFGTRRVLIWSGMLIQPPHLAVLQKGFDGHGVYCSQWFNGSPADKYSLRACRYIVQVNDVATPTLDAFLKAVDNIEHGESVRMKTLDLETKCEMVTLKTDYIYWPTMDIKFSDEKDTWVVETIKK
ncbi:hypothetical protein AeRB84_013356 [Aphanomyces euteiches]|nr:hypothetical protein AeRB84_013356 [Aphanomyces euteiches]